MFACLWLDTESLRKQKTWAMFAELQLNLHRIPFLCCTCEFSAVKCGEIFMTRELMEMPGKRGNRKEEKDQD
jgi:hypothetical protein